MRSILAGIGSYLPERIVTNDELARRLETSDAWIADRTGIRQRHIAGERETCAFMGAEAAQRRLAGCRRGPGDVDAIILATSTPDQAFPATALRVQALLGIGHGFGFDLSAACSGFIYALVGRGRDDPQRPGARRARHRQRALFAHRQLGGPGDVRAVRRRRGRGVRHGGRPHGQARHLVDPPARPGLARRPPVCGRRGRTPGPARPPRHERAGGVPPRRHPADRGGGRGAGRQRP